jgi:uncharacterized protein (TIGR03435 family)
VLHPETKEMPVYLMTWTGGQAPRKASRDAAQWLTEKPKDWPWEGRQAYIVPQIGPRDREMLVWKGSLSAAEASISDLAPVLGRIVGLPVSDRTGDIGLVNFHIEFPVDAPPNNSPVGGILNTSDRNSLFKALEKEIGLKFDASRVPVEILVVDSAEKLVEN